jgi:hypothetical protein
MEPAKIFEHACRLGLEAIEAKRAVSNLCVRSMPVLAQVPPELIVDLA